MRRPNDTGGGGLTGATGDLTPDDADEAFVPAELREISDPAHQADVTVSQGRSAPSQSGDVGEPGNEAGDRGPTELGTGESGYGSEHGLSPDDPAYRMESRQPGGRDERQAREPDRGPRIGGDDLADDEEHF